MPARSGRSRAAIVALIATCSFAMLAATAAADVEPNNVIAHAEGPIAGGTPVTGAISDGGDNDFYVLYAASQAQLHLSLADTGSNSWCEIRATLLDADGDEVPDDYTTPTGTTRLFVRVSSNEDGCANESYSFSVTGAVVGGPAMDRRTTRTGEPNESADQAHGPLRGGVNYTGVTETDNDEDWFKFYVAPGTHQLDISVTTGAPDRGCWDSSGIEIPALEASASGDPSSFGHIRQTITGPETVYLRAYSGCNNLWQFRIEPAGALTSTLLLPPPPAADPTPRGSRPSKACRKAKASVKRWTKRVAKTKRQLRKAKRARTKRKLRRKLRAQRRILRRAKNRRTATC